MPISIPGYKIIRTLGKGGMATVFLAEQEIFERQVALKVMSKKLADDPLFGKRFFREAKIVSQLVHPNIVTVHDVGTSEGLFYLSMEYIDGKELKHLRGELDLEQKLGVIRDIAKALVYAGGKGYVHRDIKPENIMIHKEDGRAVLMDFGIARAAEAEDTSVTQTGMAIGTPHYMSPEQAKGEIVDHRSDIYSLGVVFYLLITGRVPYDAESAVAIGVKHITEPVPVLPEGFDGLQPIIDGMMAKRKDRRYQSAEDLISDLDSLDVDVLDHAHNIAQLAITSGDTEISYAETIDTGGAEDPELHHDYTTGGEEFAFLYEDDQPHVRTYKRWWFLGFIVLLGGLAAGFYKMKPELVNPWLSDVKAKSAVWFEDYKEFIGSLTEKKKGD